MGASAYAGIVAGDHWGSALGLEAQVVADLEDLLSGVEPRDVGRPHQGSGHRGRVGGGTRLCHAGPRPGFVSPSAVYELVGYLGSGPGRGVTVDEIDPSGCGWWDWPEPLFSASTGFSSGAYPIVITNLVIIGIHLFFLRRLLGSKPVFTVLEVRQGSRYLEHFIEHYAEDIRSDFLPEFHYEPRAERYRAFILRDMVPAGLFICDFDESDTAQVQLDYVIPAYRDLKVARFLYSPNSTIFADPRITHLESPPGTPKYRDYLERMGFRPVRGEDGREAYRLRLADLPAQSGRAPPFAE